MVVPDVSFGGAEVSGISKAGFGVSAESKINSFVFTIISIYAPKQSSQDDTESQDGGPAGSNMTSSQLSRLKAVILARLQVHAPNVEGLRKEITLGKIRREILKTWPGATPFRFCDELGEAVADHENLGVYFRGLKRPPQEQDTAFNIFVTAVDSGDPNQLIASILRQQFLLKFMRLIDAKNSNNEGSLDSSAFRDKSASKTSLAIVRGFIKTMSADASQDVFCLPDGTPVPDSIALEQYLGLAKPTIHGNDKVPVIPVFIKKASLSILQATDELSGGILERQTPGVPSTSRGKRGQPQGIDKTIIEKLGKADHRLTDRSADELHRDKSSLQVKETLRESDYAADAETKIAHASKLNESEWDLVLKNSNAFRGWIVDFDGNRIGRAPIPAFKLREGLNLVKVADKLFSEGSTAPPPAYGEPSVGDEHTNDQVDPATGAKLPPLESKDVKDTLTHKPQAIPNFSVTDDSDIEIAAVQHEFAWSMAQNHFDKTVFEVEGSGVVEGITVGGNAAMTTEESSGSAASNKKVTKTLIATYKIPRATVYLPPADLEPTEEFVAAINRVRESRNIIDLRKLHKTFGQVFCSEIVIGGCLQTSKILTATEIEQENVQRNKFKGSVGVAIGVPQIANVSSKLSHETQDHSESGTREFNQQEALSFRATGGNTVLSADPPAWLSSVASDFISWRIIQQRDLRPVMDIVSEIPGYDQVRMWFLQATPKLTEYVVIPESRRFDARFKVDFTHQGLSRAITGSEGKIINAKVLKEARSKTKTDKPISTQAYLAHDPKHPPAHFRTYVKQIPTQPDIKKSPVIVRNGKPFIDTTVTIFQTTETTTTRIFEPAQTQAPVLFCPQTSAEADRNIPGLLADQRTVWSIEVPFGYSLMHNSLVTLKSRAAKTGKPALTLTVYRNAQGVFMPAITDNSDPVYWRILKSDHSAASSSDQIKFGDHIRLCWRFSDQASGWRDYLDDLYGRRRYDSPVELNSGEDALYLKSPFPRFEGINAQQGVSMLLSTSSDTEPSLQVLKVLSPSARHGTEDVTYNLFDISFRLDSVGNNGLGEAQDYMNVTFQDKKQVLQTTQVSQITTSEQQSAWSITQRIASRVAGSYLDQFDDLGNALSTGSPADVMKEAFKTTFKLSIPGRVATIFGWI